MARGYSNWSLREVHRALVADGWSSTDQKGSHRQYTHGVKSGKVTLPVSRNPVPPGTLRSALAQAGLTLEELERLSR